MATGRETAPEGVRISVAIVTRDRPESLERCLKSVREQHPQPYEVVISDDSTPQHIAAVQRLSQDFNCLYVNGPRRGLYANRNHAAAYCRGTHVRTVDDDHEFPRNHFALCQEAVSSDPQSIWVIGEQLASVPGPRGRGRPGQLTARGFSSVPRDSQRSWAISDGATIYPAEVFGAGHRFNEDFVFGAVYLEWGSRLYWHGYRIRELESAYVIHHAFEVGRSYSDPAISLGAGMFAMLSHSFIYQPTLPNKLVTTGQILRFVAQRPRLGTAALAKAVAVFRRHRNDLQAHGPTGSGR